MTRLISDRILFAFGVIFVALLAACDPPIPGIPGGCNDVPPCTAFNYHVDVSPLKADSTTGAYFVTTSNWHAYFGPDFSVPALSRRAATATSCAHCSGEYVTLVDSAYFTTDIVTFTNDTLKAGTNLVGRTLPTGIQRNGISVHILNHTLSNPWVRFRDSLFELRFSGTIDSLHKSASAKFRVADSTLLLR